MANKKMTLKKVVILIVAMVILIPCFFFIQGLMQGSSEYNVELYYLMNGGKLKSQEKTLEMQTEENLVEKVLYELQYGQKPEGAVVTIPESLEMTVLDITDGIVHIDFSENYYDLNGAEEAICRSAIVWSLTSLDFVKQVDMSVNGDVLVSKTGEAYGLMNRMNVLIDSSVSAMTTEYTVLKLYFSNEDATDLVVEDRVVAVNANQAREKTILEQLIAGPREESYFATIPPETKIRDVTITNDGICYVNLSQEFVSGHSGGSTGELLTTYSIVNSLCELSTIDKVQFLVEGEKLETYKGHLDFSGPFSPVAHLDMAK